MPQVIPRQLCDNAGFDATDVLNRLRQRHAAKDGSGAFFGVDVNTGALSKSHHTLLYVARVQALPFIPLHKSSL